MNDKTGTLTYGKLTVDAYKSVDSSFSDEDHSKNAYNGARRTRLASGF